MIFLWLIKFGLYVGKDSPLPKSHTVSETYFEIVVVLDIPVFFGLSFSSGSYLSKDRTSKFCIHHQVFREVLVSKGAQLVFIHPPIAGIFCIRVSEGSEVETVIKLVTCLSFIG